jgi:hypothetical protein
VFVLAALIAANLILPWLRPREVKA